MLTVGIVDGFDHYPVDPLVQPLGLHTLWPKAGTAGTPTASFVTGFNGRGKALRVTPHLFWGNLNRTIPVATQLSGHIAIRAQNRLLTGEHTLFSWRDGLGGIQCSLKVRPTGRLALYRAEANFIEESGKEIEEGVVYRLNYAIDVTNPVSSSFSLWMNADINDGFAVAGVDIMATAETDLQIFSVHSQGNLGTTDESPLYDVDDCVICHGDAINIGELEVITDGPTGDVEKDWTPSTGTDNYAMVDDIPVDSDTTYNSSTVVGNRDVQSFPVLPTSPDNIFCVSQILAANKSEAGTRTIRGLTEQAAVIYNGGNQNLSTDYTYYYEHYLNNPATLAAWLAVERNAADFGYEDVA